MERVGITWSEGVAISPKDLRSVSILSFNSITFLRTLNIFGWSVECDRVSFAVASCLFLDILPSLVG